MKFLALLLLVVSSTGLACESCDKSKEKAAQQIINKVQLPAHIKVYTDFTCRFCRMGADTINALIDKYGSQIEVEPVAFPLSLSGPGYEAAQLYEAVKVITSLQSRELNSYEQSQGLPV